MTKFFPLLSDRTLLALSALVVIAEHGDEPMQMSSIAAKFGMGARALQTDLQALSQADVIRARSGPNGGYRLARPAVEISVGQVVRAISPLRPGRSTPLPPLTGEVVNPMLAYPTERFFAALDAMTLDDMRARAASMKVAAQ